MSEKFKLLSKRQLRRKVANNVEKTFYKSICKETTASNKNKQTIFSSLSFSEKQNLCFIESNITSSVELVQPEDNCSSNELFTNNDFLILNDELVSANSLTKTNLFQAKKPISAGLDNITEKEFLENFKKWIFNNNITHKAVNELLHLIHPGFPFLKSDARTLLKTPRKVEKLKLDNGEMIYFGIEKGLCKKIDVGFKKDTTECISLKINVDGLPLFKSSSTEFWPILIQSDCFENSYPFAAAIFCGKGKPYPITAFMEQFVQECSNLLSNGIEYSGKKYRIEISLFSCDAPARAYLKRVVGHTSRIGCERCVIKAYREDYKNFYPVDSSYKSRNDSDFLIENAESNSDYIKGRSPLLVLEVGLVSQFVLDPMHLIYQGIMKRLLILYWIDGKRPYKISKASITRINFLLLITKKHTPNDFHRKVRSLDEVKRWKALEFRFFLIYCGPLVLKNILNEEYYQHFLLLHCSIFIFNNEYLLKKFFLLAKESIDNFIKNCPKIYDKFFVTYNVHSFSHLHEDVAKYGQLENFSCFVFENYLGKLKNKIRGKVRALEQINNRLLEIENMDMPSIGATNSGNSYSPIIVQHINSTYSICKKLKFKNMLISQSVPDNVVAVDRKVYVIETIFCINGVYKIVCNCFRYLKDFYIKPINSSKLGIYFGSGKSEQVIVNVDQILCKYIAIPYKNGFYLSPVSHHKTA